MESSSQSALYGCVSSLRSSMQLLDSSISILDSGVSDFPRLSKVLQTTRHFELVSESDLTAAQSSLLAEIQPEVSNLLSRVEAHLDKLERKEKSLIAKAELQEGRLARPSLSQSSRDRLAGRDNSGARGASAALAVGGAGGGLSEVEMLRMQQLRAKKDRLSFAIGRLELEAGQRERQLRKSMAFQ